MRELAPPERRRKHRTTHRNLHTRSPAIDRQTLASLIPMTAVTIALAEFLFDHTQPRWAGPWFWLGLVTTVVLLITVQILRFGKSKPVPPAKPDFSATTLVRRNPFDRGTR
jgi:hypothetical protein